MYKIGKLLLILIILLPLILGFTVGYYWSNSRLTARLASLSSTVQERDAAIASLGEEIKRLTAERDKLVEELKTKCDCLKPAAAPVRRAPAKPAVKPAPKPVVAAPKPAPASAIPQVAPATPAQPLQPAPTINNKNEVIINIQPSDEPRIELKKDGEFVPELNLERRSSQPDITLHNQASAPPARTLPLVTGLPGSFYGTIGNASPVEKGNIIGGFTGEQGITIWRSGKFFLVPFVSVTATRDTDNNDWNNRYIGIGGIKLVRAFDNGMVQAGIGYGYEKRYRSNQDQSQVTFLANHWFGWDMPTADNEGDAFLSGLPGSTYGAYGNLSPFEKNNYLAGANLQQGVNLVKLGRVSLVPYGELTGNVDRFGYTWNNKYTVGAGFKAVIPMGASVFEIGPVYRVEERWKTNERNDAFGVNASIWFGWNPPLGGGN